MSNNKKIKVRMEKLTNTENNFRTKLPYDGYMTGEPIVGLGVIVFCTDENNPGPGIYTSNIKKVKKTTTGWTIRTQNSQYKITKLGGEDEGRKESRTEG